MDRYLTTVRCRDRPGIVRALAEAIAEVKGNIVECGQFTDSPGGVFCTRTALDSPESDPAVVRAALAQHLAPFDVALTVRPERERHRVLVMASRADHCLEDLLYRVRTGELAIEVPLVVSNHDTLRPVAQRHGVAFAHLPTPPGARDAVEDRLRELVAEHRIDLVVLARYMQILSDRFCAELDGRVINIHHSFLPGFTGARPYHQAHERGVKLIGATAHYATADLDEGPIIEQDVVRVGHHETPEDLVAIGRDVERRVLARAVRLHTEDRVFRTGHRTVVLG